MNVLIVSGGPDISVDYVKSISSDYEFIVCADSGTDYVMAAGIIPNLVMGDLDSVSDEGRKFIGDNRIPLELFPVEKDMTDSELVIRRFSSADNIMFVGSLGGRVDHTISNITLCCRLHSEGYNITFTDGVSYIIPMYGSETITLSEIDNERNLNVSLIPMDFGDSVKGVSTDGLYYELHESELKFGSSFSVSNKLGPGKTSFSISIKSGIMGVFVVVED